MRMFEDFEAALDQPESHLDMFPTRLMTQLDTRPRGLYVQLSTKLRGRMGQLFDSQLGASLNWHLHDRLWVSGG